MFVYRETIDNARTSIGLISIDERVNVELPRMEHIVVSALVRQSKSFKAIFSIDGNVPSNIGTNLTGGFPRVHADVGSSDFVGGGRPTSEVACRFSRLNSRRLLLAVRWHLFTVGSVDALVSSGHRR